METWRHYNNKEIKAKEETCDKSAKMTEKKIGFSRKITFVFHTAKEFECILKQTSERERTEVLINWISSKKEEQAGLSRQCVREQI